MTPDDRLAEAWRAAAVVSIEFDAPLLSPDDVFALVVEASEPFLHGMRFRVLPSVAVDTERGRARNIVPMLPTPNTSLSDYFEKMSEVDSGWCLTVTEPVFVHYPTWSLLRSVLDRLWSNVGAPVASVRTEVLTAHGGAVDMSIGDTDETSIFYGLSGVLSLSHQNGLVDVPAGCAVLVPAGAQPRIAASDRALVVRIGVRTRGSSPITEIIDALSEAADDDDAVPYLSWSDADGEIADPLVADPILLERELADTATFERAHLVRWLGRRSAGGLEPPPDPREPEPLDESDVLALTGAVYTMPEPGTERQFWAANGQVFVVGGPVPGIVLDRLRSGPRTVAELCRDDDGEDNGALPLLYRLDAIHAVERLEGGDR